jgi:hypothetical protein
MLLEINTNFIQIFLLISHQYFINATGFIIGVNINYRYLIDQSNCLGVPPDKQPKHGIIAMGIPSDQK